MKVKTMRNRRGPQASWLGRFIRGHRLDGNPLRRRSDRAETVILGGMLVALLAGGPFAALAGGHVAHDLARQAQRSQLATERQVTAVTTQAAPTPASEHTPGVTTVPVRARWTAPDGNAVTGEVAVPLATPAGSGERVWVTLDGVLVEPPLLDSQVADLTTVGQVVSFLTLVLMLVLARGLAGHELDRRRSAAWEADWRAIDPRGTQRT
jgi:hypothetical protein